MVHMPKAFKVPNCSPQDYSTCADKALDWLVEKDNSICICGTPCTNTRYSLSTSMLRLPSAYAAHYYAQKYNKTSDYIKTNFLKVNIFFEALNYESIVQKPRYELSSLLGDIGGNMGLFIGASLLTVCEIFDYIYEVVKEKCSNIKKHLEKLAENSKN